MSFLDLDEIPVPAAPPANKKRLFADDWGVAFLDEHGSEHRIGLPVWEGQFEPSVTFATPGDLSVSYGRRAGRCSRIGGRVLFDIDLQFTLTYSTALGGFSIIGLPFSAGDMGPGPGFACAIGGYANVNVDTPDVQILARVNKLAGSVSLLLGRDNISGAILGPSNLPAGVPISVLVGGSYVAGA